MATYILNHASVTSPDPYIRKNLPPRLPYPSSPRRQCGACTWEVQKKFAPKKKRNIYEPTLHIPNQTSAPGQIHRSITRRLLRAASLSKLTEPTIRRSQIRPLKNGSPGNPQTGKPLHPPHIVQAKQSKLLARIPYLTAPIHNERCSICSPPPPHT